MNGVLKRVVPVSLAAWLRAMGTDPWERRRFAAKLGFRVAPNNTSDRRILETVIFPYFAERAEFRRVLFVGCDFYTMHYGRHFARADYWTLDYDKSRRAFGAKQHVVAPMEDVGRWFEPETLDVVFCNGVYGWGLDEPENVERAFAATYDILRPAGAFVLGWNDLPARRRYPLKDCQALRRFQPWHFEPLGSHQTRTDSSLRHVFNFYLKPAAAVAGE